MGGSSGIGLATARLAHARGAQPVLVGRSATKLATAAEAIGPEATSAVADATDRTALDSLFRELGRVDHLVLAASGGRGAGVFADLNADGLRAGFEAKFWAHWNGAQAALPVLAPEGSITLITAASSRLANPGTSGLAAINGALERMVPTLARELAPRRVNAVSPGVIDTEWWADKPRSMFESASKRAPLGRSGRADEVADAVMFLIGNAFVTGVVLDVDGGLHLT
ncbi:SDR family oxidoreductase [Micromonospora sp. STR1s_5]|nr:SDR family oxidoreductase [Micromonospora sp. STR1s_5]